MNTNYISLLEDNLQSLNEILPLGKIRRKAIKDLTSRSIPSLKMEQWKNYHFADTLNNYYRLNIEKENPSFNLKFIKEFPLQNAFESIVFENDRCSYEGQVEKFQNGVILGSLLGVMNEFPDIIEKYLDKLNTNSHGFLALNSGIVVDGFVLFVPENIDKNLVFNIYESFDSGENTISGKRNLVIIGEKSQATVNLFTRSENTDHHFALSTTEVYLSKGSGFEMNNIQDHNGNTQYLNFQFFDQKKGSSLKSNYITFNSYNTRNEIINSLNDIDCQTELNGAYLLKNEQKLENNIFIDHASPECLSNQLFKGILYDKAEGSFTGKILVRKDSQKTEAYQSTKNILLSDDARMNMNPFLEIYADDVRCSHGASLGNVDDDALFYLQARGINKEEARKILLRSFLNDIILKVSDEELQNMINEHMFAKL